MACMAAASIRNQPSGKAARLLRRCELQPPRALGPCRAVPCPLDMPGWHPCLPAFPLPSRRQPRLCVERGHVQLLQGPVPAHTVLHPVHPQEVHAALPAFEAAGPALRSVHPAGGGEAIQCSPQLLVLGRAALNPHSLRSSTQRCQLAPGLGGTVSLRRATNVLPAAHRP